MKGNLMDKLAAETIIKRVEKLEPDANRLWGKMTATEMLYHCTTANNFIFDDRSDYQIPTLKQRLVKFICFRILTRIPRNNKQPSRINAIGKIGDDKFVHQKHLYIQTIEKFPKQIKPLTSLHPRMGFLTNKEWGIIAWMHMDHHLRQFGV